MVLLGVPRSYQHMSPISFEWDLGLSLLKYRTLQFEDGRASETDKGDRVAG